MSFIGMPKIDFLAQWNLLSEQHLGVKATSVSFTGLSLDYKGWVLTSFATQETTFGHHTIRLNNDSGANYDSTFMESNGATIIVSAALAKTTYDLAFFTLTASTAGGLASVLTIFKPIATGAATMHFRGSLEGSGVIYTIQRVGHWDNIVEPLSRIDYIADAGDLGVDTNILLEGTNTR